MEMLVVLAIIAVVAGISLPFAKQRGQAQKLQATSTELAALMRSARLQALTSGHRTTLLFDEKQRLWQLSDTGNSVAIAPEFSQTILTIRDEVLTTGVGIRFLPTGGSSGGAVKLSTGNDAISVHVSWLTGAITITNAGNAK